MINGASLTAGINNKIYARWATMPLGPYYDHPPIGSSPFGENTHPANGGMPIYTYIGLG